MFKEEEIEESGCVNVSVVVVFAHVKVCTRRVVTSRQEKAGSKKKEEEYRLL